MPQLLLQILGREWPECQFEFDFVFTEGEKGSPGGKGSQGEKGQPGQKGMPGTCDAAKVVKPFNLATKNHMKLLLQSNYNSNEHLI